MLQDSSVQQFGPLIRFALSLRGFTTEAGCPELLRSGGDPASLALLNRARGQWAHIHGLTSIDVAYLHELRAGPLTMGQFGEALAILGQTQEMVIRTVGRLESLGFIQRHDVPQTIRRPTEGGIRLELTTALEELEVVLSQFESNVAFDRPIVNGTLRRAIGRVLAARQFLELDSDRHGIVPTLEPP